MDILKEVLTTRSWRVPRSINNMYIYIYMMAHDAYAVAVVKRCSFLIAPFCSVSVSCPFFLLCHLMCVL